MIYNKNVLLIVEGMQLSKIMENNHDPIFWILHQFSSFIFFVLCE